MSGKIMGQVWELDLPHAEQLVLLAMADHADHEGNNIFPSVGLVAWKTGYSHRQTQRIIKILVDKGLLVFSDESGMKGTKNYSVAFEHADIKSPYTGRDKLDSKKRAELLSMLLIKYSFTCTYCKNEGDVSCGPDGKSWNIDRVIPGIQGGKYTEDNIVLSCHTCNMQKGPNKSSRSTNNRYEHVGDDKMSPLYMGDDKSDMRGVTFDGTGVTPRAVRGDTQMSHKPSLTVNKEPSVKQQLGVVSTHYMNNINVITSTMAEILKGAVEESPESWIIEAIDIAVTNNVRKWSYIQGILDNWHTNGKNSKRPGKSSSLGVLQELIEEENG